jgi:membrane protein
MERKLSEFEREGVGGRWQDLRANVMAWVWKAPAEGHTKPALIFHAAIRIIFILVFEFRRDTIPLRASALTYTVVLSMVPMLALGTAVLKGLGAGDQMKEAAYRIIDQFDSSTVQEGAAAVPESLEDPSMAWDGPGEVEEEGVPPESGGLVGQLRMAVDKIFDYVKRTNFATLGAFGILGLLFAVISVLGSIEQAMNVIWETESGRPLGRKVMDYLALMILFPVSINVGLAAEATLKSETLLSRINVLLPVSWILSLVLKMVPVIVLVATFTILYRFLPNTKVRVLPAFVGGLVGGIGWLLVQGLYVYLQIGVARYNAIYGSFAILPLFMVWIYVGWVVFLTGAETAFSFQNWRRYVPGVDTLAPIVRLALAFDVLDGVFADYSQRHSAERSRIARRLEISEAQVGKVLEDLEAAKLLKHLDEEAGEYVPAAPAEKIEAVEVVDAICGRKTQTSPGGQVAKQVFDSARKALAGKTLADQL